MRDDPYYIVDDRSYKAPPLHDVDSIPVVRLDDLPPMPKGHFSNLHLPLLLVLTCPYQTILDYRHCVTHQLSWHPSRL
jgi:hypothetical protein